MNLKIRAMEPSEAQEAKKVGQKSFGMIDGNFFRKPQMALIAVLDEKIVGGFVYKFEVSGGKKIGFVSHLFTDPDHHGKGIGKRLCEEGFKHLWNQGCYALATYVRDDNVASWAIFVKNGFVRASLPKLAKLLGLSGMAKLFVKTTYSMSIVHDFYIALRDEKSTPQYAKKSGIGQIVAFVLINILFFVPISFRVQYRLWFIASLLLIFLGVVLTGYIGTLFSKRKWSFRLPSGGALVYLMNFVTTMSLFPTMSFLPMAGAWYPSRYENTPEFKRDLAVNAIAAWFFLLCIPVAALIVDETIILLAHAAEIASVLLVIRCLPIPVFDSVGFGRIFRWNKLVFILLAAASILIVFVL